MSAMSSAEADGVVASDFKSLAAPSTSICARLGAIRCAASLVVGSTMMACGWARRRIMALRASGALSRVQQTVRRAPGGHCQTVRIRGQVSTLNDRNTVSGVRQGRLGMPACLVSFVHRRSTLCRPWRPIEQQVRGPYRTEISRLLDGLLREIEGQLT